MPQDNQHEQKAGQHNREQDERNRQQQQEQDEKRRGGEGNFVNDPKHASDAGRRGGQH